MPLPRPLQRPSRQPPSYPQSPPQPAPVQQPVVHEVRIQLPAISFRFGEEFKARLPFLFLLVLLFAFSLVMFEKSNFHTIDLVDIARIQYNLPKLYSVSFILFLFLFSFALALAVFFGLKQSWVVSLLVLPATLVPAFVLALFYPTGYMLPFLAFALTLSVASFIAAHRTQVKLSSIWGTVGAALLVLVVLTFFIAFGKISANKDAYMNTFIASGVTTSIQQLTQVTPTLAESAGFQLSEDAIKNAVTKEQLAAVITKERVDAALEKIPGWNSIANRSVYAADVRKQLIDDLHKNIGKDVMSLLSGVMAQANATASATPSVAAGELLPSAVKKVLGQTPAFVVFYDNFALLMSVLIASIVSFFGFLMKIIATAICWLLTKL